MFGEWFEFDVVNCCGFTNVEKSAYFGHLNFFFFFKYKFSSFINSQFEWKIIVEMNILWKINLPKITLKQKTSNGFHTKCIRRIYFLTATLPFLTFTKVRHFWEIFSLTCFDCFFSFSFKNEWTNHGCERKKSVVLRSIENAERGLKNITQNYDSRDVKSLIRIEIQPRR